MTTSTSERGRRNAEKERFWRETIAEQGRGGESVRAFCRSRGLRETSFYHWRREIRLRDREKDGTSSPPLAPVVLVDDFDGKRVDESDASVIEIALRDGTTVRVPPGSTRETLDLVFDVLERTRC